MAKQEQATSPRITDDAALTKAAYWARAAEQAEDYRRDGSTTWTSEDVLGAAALAQAFATIGLAELLDGIQRAGGLT